MGNGSSTRVCRLNGHQSSSNSNDSSWLKKYFSFRHSNSCRSEPSSSGPVYSYDRRPEAQKREDRQNIAKRATEAEQRAKDAEAKARGFENKIRELTVQNTELQQEIAWRKNGPQANNTLDYSFLHHSYTESSTALKEKDQKIEELNIKLNDAQEALDRASASEAVKDLVIVEQQREIDALQIRIASLEEFCRSKVEDDSLASISPTPEHSTAPEEIGKDKNRSFSSVQPEHIRRNMVMIEPPRRLAQKIAEEIRQSDDSDADIQEILNTQIRGSPNATARSKKDQDQALF